MASATNVVETVLKLQGSREFQQQAKQSAKSITGIGSASEKSGKKAKMGWKGVAAWAGGAATIYAAGRYIKSAVTSTDDLAKSTLTLQRATGLDAATASSWSEILKVRGVNTKQFQTSLTKLSKTMYAAAHGSKTALDTFHRLGITQDEVRKGNVQDVILKSADAFAAMKNPAAKAALASQLFGKSYAPLMGLLSQGSAGINDQMGLIAKYGARLGSTEGAKEMIAKQREMQYAFDGLKITLGTKLLPVIEQIIAIFLTVVQALQPILRNGTALAVVLGSVTAAFVVLKVNAVMAALAVGGVDAAFLLIPLAIAAVVAGIVVLYGKWKWFHDAVDNTFQWIKKHWPLLATILTGGVAWPIIEIVKHFGTLKSAAMSAWGVIKSVAGWMSNAFHNVRDAVKSIGRAAGSIGSAFASVFKGVVATVKGAINVIIRGWNGLKFHVPHIHVGPLHVGGGTIGVPQIKPLAEGGTLRSAGSVLVGEQGPELLNLPRAARVTPLTGAAAGGGGLALPIVTQVFLDKRQIAEAVGAFVGDKKARR